VSLGGGADLVNEQVRRHMPKPPVGEGGGRAVPIIWLKLKLDPSFPILSPSGFGSGQSPRRQQTNRSSSFASDLLYLVLLFSLRTELEERGCMRGRGGRPPGES
jgi:hypothetical protein